MAGRMSTFPFCFIRGRRHDFRILAFHLPELFGSHEADRSARLLCEQDPRRLLHKIKRSEEHTSELQSRGHLVCRLLLEKKKRNIIQDPCYTSFGKKSTAFHDRTLAA